MKFLAILKDGFREAIDLKVFYVMVGLSCLLTVLVASLSFTPRPAGRQFMDFMAMSLNQDLSNLDLKNLEIIGRRDSLSIYQVEGAEPLNGAADAPQSPFLVTIAARFPTARAAAAVRQAPAQTAEFIKQRFGSFDELKVEEATSVRLAEPQNHFVPQPPSPDAAYFEVVTQPTRATLRLWPYDLSVFFGALPLDLGLSVPLGYQIYAIEDYVVNGLGAWVAILVSVVITAFFIPNMLRKGTVDLLLVKPIHRSTLLLYKYVGGLTFIFLNTTLAVGGVWLALGLRSGIWSTGFLLSIFIITFFFAVLYAVSTLFGVLTRSPIVAILLTCLVWFVLFGVGKLYQEFERESGRAGSQAQHVSDGWFASGVRTLHMVLPRTADLDALTSRLLLRDLLTANQIREQKLETVPITWGESLTVSGAFIAVMLGLSCWRFAATDY